jgi:hypothetical protein
LWRNQPFSWNEETIDVAIKLLTTLFSGSFFNNYYANHFFCIYFSHLSLCTAKKYHTICSKYIKLNDTETRNKQKKNLSLSPLNQTYTQKKVVQLTDLSLGWVDFVIDSKNMHEGQFWHLKVIQHHIMCLTAPKLKKNLSMKFHTIIGYKLLDIRENVKIGPPFLSYSGRTKKKQMKIVKWTEKNHSSKQKRKK